TSTSTSTTTAHATSTTQPPDCTTAPVNPTFASIDCHLAALIDEVAVDSQLGTLQTKLSTQIQSAGTRTTAAAPRCRQGSRRGTRKRLRAGIKKIGQFLHTLGSARAQTIPQTERDALRTIADGIRSQMKLLLRAVQCPADAPSIRA